MSGNRIAERKAAKLPCEWLVAKSGCSCKRRRPRLQRNSVPRSVPKQRPWPDHQPPPTKPGDIFAFHLRGQNRWTTTNSHSWRRACPPPQSPGPPPVVAGGRLFQRTSRFARALASASLTLPWDWSRRQRPAGRAARCPGRCRRSRTLRSRSPGTAGPAAMPPVRKRCPAPHGPGTTGLLPRDPSGPNALPALSALTALVDPKYSHWPADPTFRPDF